MRRTLSLGFGILMVAGVAVGYASEMPSRMVPYLFGNATRTVQTVATPVVQRAFRVNTGAYGVNPLQQDAAAYPVLGSYNAVFSPTEKRLMKASIPARTNGGRYRNTVAGYPYHVVRTGQEYPKTRLETTISSSMSSYDVFLERVQRGMRLPTGFAMNSAGFYEHKDTGLLLKGENLGSVCTVEDFIDCSAAAADAFARSVESTSAPTFRRYRWIKSAYGYAPVYTEYTVDEDYAHYFMVFVNPKTGDTQRIIAQGHPLEYFQDAGSVAKVFGSVAFY